MDKDESVNREAVGDYISECVNRQSFTDADLTHILSLIEPKVLSDEEIKDIMAKMGAFKATTLEGILDEMKERYKAISRATIEGENDVIKR